MTGPIEEYLDKDCWVAFKMWPDKNHKIAKRPIDPNQPSTSFASIKDPSTWSGIDLARRKCEELKDAGYMAQLGLATSAAPGLCFFDLDDCYDEVGILEDWAQELIDNTGDTLAHETPSGKGLRIICSAPDRKEVHTSVDMGEGKVEIFQNTDRFVTVAQEMLPGREKVTFDGTHLRDALRRNSNTNDGSKSGPTSQFEWGDDTGAEFEPTDCVEGERSEFFASDIYRMLRQGLSPYDCLRNLTGSTAAEKYERSGRLEREIQRVCGKFAHQNGRIPYFQNATLTADRHDQKIVSDEKQAGNQMLKPKRKFLGPIDFYDAAPQDWLVDDMIPTATTGVIFGEPGTFKTFFALHVGLSLSAGRHPFTSYGKQCEKIDPVHMIMIAGEGESTLRLRINAACQEGLGLDLKYTVSPNQENFIDRKSIEALAMELHAHLDDVDPDAPVVIIVDTLSQNMSGDENGNELTEFVRNLEWLRRVMVRNGKAATACAIHHTLKDGKNYRGHSSLHGNVDWMLQLRKSNSLQVTVNRYKSKIASTGEDVATLQLRNVKVRQICPIDDCFDEELDVGMNDTLVVQPELLNASVELATEIEIEEWLDKEYNDGDRRVDLVRRIHDEFGVPIRKATKLVDEWIAGHESLTTMKAAKNAVVINGVIEPKAERIPEVVS